jgi:hypothetical protein
VASRIASGRAPDHADDRRVGQKHHGQLSRGIDEPTVAIHTAPALVLHAKSAMDAPWEFTAASPSALPG